MTNIVTRNANIVRDFAKGNITKAQLARNYGVDEKTIRRVLKANAAPVATKPAPVPAQKDVKASVKQKAQNAVGKAGVTKSAKASTTSSAPSQSAITHTFKVGERVRAVGGNAIGVVQNVQKRFTYGEPNPVVIVEVLWPKRMSTVSFYPTDLISAELDVKAPTVPAKPAEKGVKAALKAGQAVQFVMTGDSIMLTLGDDVEIVDASHQNYKQIKLAIAAEEFEKAYELMNISKAITSFTKGAITVSGGVLYYGELPMHSNLVTRILNMMEEGDTEFEKMVKFLERLLNNPSKASVNELWDFMAHLDVEIDNDGMIVGWKKVCQTADGLRDSRTGKVPNDVGNLVEMPRFMVNDDRDQTCSQGLHIGAWQYVASFSGDTILKVLVDPADVVSVPSDYHGQKMRAAKYTVITAVDGSKRPIDTKTHVKPVHVKVGQNGQILDSKPL